MSDYIIVQIIASYELPEGWKKESEKETEDRARRLFEEVCGGHSMARMDDWWVGP